MKKYFDEVELDVVELITADVVTESEDPWGGTGNDQPGT